MRQRAVCFVLVSLFILSAGMVPQPADASTDPDTMVTLTVAVTDPSGNPVSNANLTASWDSGSTSETTAANGKAFIDVPAGANVTITVDHPEYVRNEPVIVTNATKRTVPITVWPIATAHLTVVDANGPVANASVRLAKNGSGVVSLMTNASGVVETGEIEAGTYTITVNRTGYMAQTVTADLAGETTRQITIHRAATVVFTVVDDHFTPPRPIMNVTIAVEGVGRVVIGTDGRGEVTVPANTSLRVSATKPGYRTVNRTLTIERRERRVNLTMRRIPELSLDVLNRKVVVGEQLRVEVTDEYGMPVVNATVLLDGVAVGATDGKGVALIRIEEAGTHVLRVRTELRSSENRTIRGVPAMTKTPESTATLTPTSTPTSTETSTNTPAAGAASEQESTTAMPDDTDPEVAGSGMIGGVHLLSTGFGVLIGFVLAAIIAGVWQWVNRRRRSRF